MYDAIIRIAQQYDFAYLLQAPLSEISSFRTGGAADLLVMPNSREALRDVLMACKTQGIRFCVIGNASNLLIADAGFPGVVIRIGAAMSEIKLLENNQIYCAAGASLTALCNFAWKHALSGLEFAYGIPGSAGGAAYMNAGAYGGEMKDVLVSCAHIAPDGAFGTFCGTALALDYRKSIYTDAAYVITDMTLQLQPGNASEIETAMKEKMQRRKEKQPLEYPSAGSTFKRPAGHFAGALIEQCGLKGFSVGGAQVSEKHAGFVINTGGATTADILDLIAHIQKTVLEKCGVALQTEVKYLA